MFTLYRIVFGPTQKPYRIGLLFTQENSDFGAISVTEQSFATPISKVRSHISDDVYTIPVAFRAENFGLKGTKEIAIKKAASYQISDDNASSVGEVWRFNPSRY